MADRSGTAAAMDVEAEVVIVGAGIAGLATALALRRVGVGVAPGGVLVLERHAELRSAGAALTIFPNGWFALHALGVAHKLISRYDAFETCVFRCWKSDCCCTNHFCGSLALISCVCCIYMQIPSDHS
jgi:threonine dehydrogenase-like Zn-dependent dehydrogenase